MMTLTVLFKHSPKLFKSRSQIPIFPGHYYTHTYFFKGIFANGHMSMDYARDKSPKGMPSLANMTQRGLDILAKNPRGYIFVVEGGLIDYAHHRGHARKALDETVSFSDAIQVALEKTDPQETLIIVTSDHSHSLVFSGYASRDSNILGTVRDTEFRASLSIYCKKCKIGFTLLTSILPFATILIDMRLT
jgi:alkaline phosphatase